MPPDSTKRRPEISPWLLRRADQAAVGGLVAAGLAAMGVWWAAHGGWSGRLVEVDRAADQTARFQVDLNAAEWPELAQLPGIGETLARRIVESREAEGPFLDQDDLQRVHGIGPKTLDEVRPYLLPMPIHKAVAGKETHRQ
jgi:competence protein ComEA